jgi:hypothetical protein
MVWRSLGFVFHTRIVRLTSVSRKPDFYDGSQGARSAPTYSSPAIAHSFRWNGNKGSKAGPARRAFHAGESYLFGAQMNDVSNFNH